MLGLLAFLAFTMFMGTSNIPEVYYVSEIYLLIIVFIQIKRQDKIFLKSHFNNYNLIYFIEYLLLSIPIIVCLIFHYQWMIVAVFLFAISLIVNIDFKPKHRSLNTKIQQLIPNDCFEWKAGVRKTLFVIIIFWVIGLGTSFYIGSVPIVILILGIIPLNFYEKGEPYQMIIAYKMNTSKFLFYKIKMQIMLFSILSIPLIVGFIIFHSENWYIPVAEYFIIISLQIYVILTKYAFYEPNSKSSVSSIFGIIGVLGLFIPIFIPIVWLLSLIFYFKSYENLNLYLNDYN